ncbi:hypothetical protein STCU_03937 [Strigomonas culicis]|uniref:C2H2-type domain-containing protein n=1 Tax=Strigomonas culicis TaxID=28005 RepID=S9TNY9_9TRYP|nr:hypothetical protein STCU_09203 [Strigomonas culicis]EPY22893.1 hypothetical protein STCU_08066 [Strigomonas culicis]EPY30698.1 hypothetical protein STCU_03937 [Strigomonas culicis]|eukprot:EPY19997.1 hypothetical protein STCU_09203 [Strigomonas culicis]
MSSNSKREEWIINFQFFLSSRLRSPTFADASRVYQTVTAPSMIANTQYLLDGILWAINDHEEWYLESWMAIQNHIRDCSERYKEVAKQRREAKEAEPLPPGSEREGSYNAQVAVQDLYLSLCVVDIVFKNALGKKEEKLRLRIEEALPSLASEYVPLFDVATNVWVEEALHEYQSLLLNLLRSWHQIASSDTRRRMEDLIRFKLKHARDSIQSEASGGGPSADAWRDGLAVILRSTSGTVGGGSGAASSAAPATSASAQRNPNVVRQSIRGFLNSVFPQRPTEFTKFPCPHCGSFFKSEEVKNIHYRYHFYSHNTDQKSEKLVRLLYPTRSEFVDAVGRTDGSYVRVVEKLDDAYRNGAKGAMKLS